VFGSNARRAQNEEQLAGPKHNVKQARALQIREIFALQAYFEGPARAFFDEGAHRGEVHALFTRFLAALIQHLQFGVAAQEEMVQA